MRSWALLGSSLLLVGSTMGAGPIDDIYFFGDSLTDTGNLTVLQSHEAAPPFPPGRFCDGPMWPEFLSSMLLGDDRYGSPFLYGDSSPLGNNYAIGGATTFDNPGNNDLPQQIQAVIAHQGGTLNPRSLYIFSFPTADLASYYRVTPAQQLNAGVALFFTWQSARNLYQAIERLHAAGARQFLVFNTPNLGNTPGFKARGLEPVGNLLSIMSNVFLQGTLSAFPNALSGDLYLLDFFGLSNFFHLDSALLGGYFFGLQDFTNPCLVQTNGQAVPNPDCSRSTFVDEIHLTSHAHSWVATMAVNVLANPPLYSVPAR